MVFFPNIDFSKNKTLGKEVVAEAMAWAAKNDYGVIPVKGALTYMWGCGPGCESSAALVDVSSALAKMKYGLMDLFEGKGYEVDRTSWGGTAHIQVKGAGRPGKEKFYNSSGRLD